MHPNGQRNEQTTIPWAPDGAKNNNYFHHNLECLELDEKLRAPSGEAGELVQPEPELRAGIPEAADILRQVPGEIINGVLELASLLKDDPSTLLELDDAK